MTEMTSGRGNAAKAMGLRMISLAMMLALLAGCSSSDTAAPVSTAPPAAAVSSVVGLAGGTVTGPDGVQVVIPEGALSTDTTIGIARSAAGAPAALDAYPVAGNVYELTPHDLLFNRPVIIRAPVPSGALGTLVFMASPGEDWNFKDATVVNGVASWERNSFSFMYYGTGVCSVPMSMVKDPFWCVWDRSFARISASPTSAMTLTAPPVFQNGDVGAYRVDAPANLQFESHPSVAGNCSNVTVALKRRRVNETTLQWGPQQTLSTQRPALTPVGSRLNGTATFSLPFTNLDNGKNHFALVVSFECPGVLRQNGIVVGYDTSTVRSRTMGDGMLVVGNITQPTVFSPIIVTVSGLTGAGLVLHNGSDSLPVSTDGSFTFPTTIAAGSTYRVSILPQPLGQTCTVSNGSGTASGLAVNVAVTCVNGSTKAWQGAVLLETIDQGGAFESQIAFDVNGNALAVWSQPSSLDGKLKIWARRYVLSTGWGTVEQIQTTDNTLEYRTPQIAFDANGNAIVVFAGFHPDGSVIWAARYTAASSSWAVATQLTDIGINPQIAIDTSGNAMVVWEAWNGGANDIRARRYVATTGVWQVAQLIEASTGPASSPQIIFDANGNAMAVWDQWDGSTRDNIRANRYVAGTGWGSASSIDTGAGNNAARPQIASDAVGNMMAVWQGFDGTTTSIYSNRYSAGLWGTAVLVESSANFAEQSAIAINGSGDAIVVWTEVDPFDVTSMWARRYVAGVGGTAIQIDDLSEYFSGSSPQIAIDANGNAMAVWMQDSYIWANRYVVGAGWGAATLIDSTTAGSFSTNPQIAVDGNGNVAAVWSHNGIFGPDVWGNVFR